MQLDIYATLHSRETAQWVREVVIPVSYRVAACVIGVGIGYIIASAL